MRTFARSAGLGLLLRAASANLGHSAIPAPDLARATRAHLERLAKTADFSGAVLIAKDGNVLFRQAYGLANRADGVPNRVDTRFNLASMGKMFTAVAILQLLESGRLSVGDLAESLGISHVSVSQTRDSLACAGLVSSRKDPNDARRRTLHLTRKGQQLVQRLIPVWSALSDVASELDAEAGQVVSALERLDQALNRASLYERVRVRLSGFE